ALIASCSSYFPHIGYLLKNGLCHKTTHRHTRLHVDVHTQRRNSCESSQIHNRHVLVIDYLNGHSFRDRRMSTVERYRDIVSSHAGENRIARTRSASHNKY